MANIQHVSLEEIVAYFDELEDPRSTAKLPRPLVSKRTLESAFLLHNVPYVTEIRSFYVPRGRGQPRKPGNFVWHKGATTTTSLPS